MTRTRVGGVPRRLGAGAPWARPERAGIRRQRPLSAVPLPHATVGASAAYLAAGLLPGKASVLAPLTALLVLQSTLYETLSSGLQRVLSVVAGVLVAVLVATVVGLTWWSIGLVVLVSLLVGQRLRLGEQLMETPISAMLVLAVGAHAEAAAQGRVYETLLGAAVGVGVRALTPPLYVQTAAGAIGELAQRTSELFAQVAAGLDEEWTPAQADRWLRRARALPGPVQQAREALATADESLRLNPRRRTAAHAQHSLHAGLTALEHATVHARVICRSLSDRVEGLGPGVGTGTPSPSCCSSTHGRSRSSGRCTAPCSATSTGCCGTWIPTPTASPLW